MQRGEKQNRRAKKAVRGLREKKKTGEPVDVVLMPPVLWYHDLIGQIADC